MAKLETRSCPLAARPYLELIRLPAVFTAPADVLAGAALSGAVGFEIPVWALVTLAASSALVYCAGMAVNDIFDLETDHRERPERPIPSGRVSVGRAWLLTIALQVVAVGLALLVGGAATAAVGGTIGVTYLYNTSAKNRASGPVVMGLCRYGNAMIGVAAAGAWPAVWLPYVVPVGTLIYVVALTEIARHEAMGAGRSRLAPAQFVLLAASFLPIAWPLCGALPLTWAAGLVLVPALWLVAPLVRARSRPGPREIRALVMAGIFGIALVDGVVAAVAGRLDLAVAAVALLLPGRALGRWFYAT